MCVPTREEPAELCAFSDASFALTGTKSSAVFSRNVPISWKSLRQPFVTLSTAEIELAAASEAALLLKSVHALDARGIKARLLLMVDNQAAVSLFSEGVGSWRTRLLKLRYSWLRERFCATSIEIIFVPGRHQRADLGMKPLPGDRLRDLMGQWGFVFDKTDEQEEGQHQVAGIIAMLRLRPAFW